MGRKVEMKKIENVTKCQVTFSKRRSSLIKKANEIAICCDVDVAFVAFSPSGRVSKFCNQKRIEDVLNQYVNLPADKRLNHISNVEAKMEKLKQLGRINGDTSKLQYLDKQIENLELQIKKSGLELQILETDLRDYEIGQEPEHSLHQLSWCERNLEHSLQRVIARKDFLQMEQIELQNQPQAPYSSTLNENGQLSTAVNPFTGQILMQLDPWISPYSARVRESIFQDFFDQGKHTANGNPGPSSPSNFSIPLNISNFSIQESPTIFGSEIITSDVHVPPPYIPLEQPLMVDQPVPNFHDQISVNAWNNTSSVVFSDATPMSSQNLCNSQDSRFASITTPVIPNPSGVEMLRSLYNEMGTGLQYPNPNLMSQFSNMEGQEIGGQLNMDHNGSFINGNPRNEDYCGINCNETQKNDQPQDVYFVQPPEEFCEGARSDSLFLEDTNGDNTLWTSKIQRTGLWEWEDWLLDENFNFQNVSQA